MGCTSSTSSSEGFYSNPREGMYSTLAGQLTPGILDDAWQLYTSPDHDSGGLPVRSVQEMLLYLFKSFPTLYKKSVKQALSTVQRYHANQSDFEKNFKPLYAEVKDMVGQMERAMLSVTQEQQDKLIKMFTKQLETDAENCISVEDFNFKFRTEFGPEMAKFLLGLEANGLHHFAEQQTGRIASDLRNVPDLENRERMFSDTAITPPPKTNNTKKSSKKSKDHEDQPQQNKKKGKGKSSADKHEKKPHKSDKGGKSSGKKKSRGDEDDLQLGDEDD